MRPTWSIISVSMARRPAVSTMQTSRPRRRASSTPARAGATGATWLPPPPPPAAGAGLPEPRHVDALPQRAELFDGGRPLQVGSHQQGVPALLTEPACGAGGVARLTGPLKAGHEHDRPRPGGVLEPNGLAAEGLDQRLVDQLDDLLGW